MVGRYRVPIGSPRIRADVIRYTRWNSVVHVVVAAVVSVPSRFARLITLIIVSIVWATAMAAKMEGVSGSARWSGRGIAGAAAWNRDRLTSGEDHPAEAVALCTRIQVRD